MVGAGSPPSGPGAVVASVCRGADTPGVAGALAAWAPGRAGHTHHSTGKAAPVLTRMPARHDADLSAQFLRVLGDELRRARRRRGWRRADLRERLGHSISMQAIASYEQGIRSCTVVRLLELTTVLDESMPALIERALSRVTETQSGLIVDLVSLATARDPRLAPLRRWAQSRLDHSRIRESTVLRIGDAGIEWLARVCGLSTEELIRLVSVLDPE
jgi:transcriptional regulator with XRE-family HTH domain